MAYIMITLAPLFLLLSCVFSFPHTAITVLTPDTNKSACFKPDINSLQTCLNEFVKKNKSFKENRRWDPSCPLESTWMYKDGKPMDSMISLCPDLNPVEYIIYGQGISTVKGGGPRDCGCEEVQALATMLVTEVATAYDPEVCTARESARCASNSRLADLCSAAKLSLDAETDSRSSSVTNDISITRRQ